MVAPPPQVVEPREAGRSIKEATGVAWEAMLRFSCDAPALREAARQGATAVQLATAAPAGGGGRSGDGPLGSAALDRGLTAHAAKLEDSRGY
jgi:hypothetical protein